MKKNELEKIVFIDFETTGLNALNDDIISICALNGLGNLLFLRYCHTKKRHFFDAEFVNGLNYNLLAKCKSFYNFRKELQKIINQSDKIVLWCCDFDLAFFEKYKIKIDEKKLLCLQKMWCLKNDRDFEFAPSLATLASLYNCDFNAKNILSKTLAQITIFKGL